ncbi:MAG TPA: hypothetical protein VHO70_07625 [Chitinispirillaceae bacterium]|nr:hypothetical protein [Chitinispirillaceae bacterium]
MKKSKLSSLNSKYANEKTKDVGFVVLLFLMMFHVYTKNDSLIFVSIITILVSILFPGILAPFAWIWYGLSELLGIVVSRIILTLIFYVVITPVGLLRRLIVRKRMKMECWKKDTGSIFTLCEKTFSTTDIENPF